MWIQEKTTETAALSFTDTIRRHMDQGLLTGSVFIDLRKAFDTIDHTILLKKLKHYGVHDQEYLWFANYLSNRSQVVFMGNVASETCKVHFGVPQGSILGPLLFVIFVNDLPQAIRRCKILTFADDTVMFFASKSVSEIEKVLTVDLATLHQWLLENNLFLNVKKTECLLFGTAPRLSKIEDFKIIVGSSVLKRVTEYKYLGVTLDEHLNWKAHTSILFSKASKRIGLLRQIRDDISTYAANNIYKSFILPLFDYCDSVWTCCNKVDAESLERLQRCAAKVVILRASGDEAMDILRWTPLYLRREQHVFKLVKKSLDGIVPQFLMNHFVPNHQVCERKTRQSNQLRLPKVRTKCAKKSFYYNGCIVYNTFLR